MFWGADSTFGSRCENVTQAWLIRNLSSPSPAHKDQHRTVTCPMCGQVEMASTLELFLELMGEDVEFTGAAVLGSPMLKLGRRVGHLCPTK